MANPKFDNLISAYARNPEAFEALPAYVKEQIKTARPSVDITPKKKIVHMMLVNYVPDGTHVRLPLCVPEPTPVGILGSHWRRDITCTECLRLIDVLDNCNTYAEAMAAFTTEGSYAKIKDTRYTAHYGIGELMPEEDFLKLILTASEEAFLMNMVQLGLLPLPKTEDEMAVKAEVLVEPELAPKINGGES